MRYVAGVSWPRSGHHLLDRMLSAYFVDGYRHHNSYLDGRPPFCTERLVADKLNFSKYHGDDALPISGDLRYLIQVRHFIPSTISLFEAHSLYGRVPDTPESFHEFLARRLPLYRSFVADWIVRPAGSNMLLVRYEDLTERTDEQFARILAYMDPVNLPDAGRLESVIASVGREYVSVMGTFIMPGLGIGSPKEPENFRYFDQERFAAIEFLLKDELAVAGCPIRWAI